MGAAPRRWARAASECSRSGLSPGGLAGLGGGGDQAAHLVERGGAGLDRSSAGDPQGADRFDRPSAGLRRAHRGAGKSCPGGGDSVDRIGLALCAASAAVRPVDLQDGDLLAGQIASQAGPVAADALHAHGSCPPEGAHPGQRIRVTGGRRGELGVGQESVGAVDDRGVVRVAVDVDTTDERSLLGCRAGEVRLSRLSRDLWTRRRSGDADDTVEGASRTGSYRVTTPDR